MELYYTVVSQQGATQSKPSMSLGGFQSSSLVPNAALGNLFDELSSYSLQNPQPEYIGLILKNTWGTVLNLSMWIEAPVNSLCKYRLAPVELTDNGEMELIPSMNSKPMYAEFEETSIDNKLILSLPEEGFLQGQMLGLWIERSINKCSNEFLKRNDCDTLYQMFQEGIQWDTEEEVELKIEFSA